MGILKNGAPEWQSMDDALGQGCARCSPNLGKTQLGPFDRMLRDP
jgi:hypothetical protein